LALSEAGVFCVLKWALRGRTGTVFSVFFVLLVRGTTATDIVDGVPPEYLAASRKGVGPDQWDAFEAQVWAKLLDFQTRAPTPIEKLIAGKPHHPPSSRTV